MMAERFVIHNSRDLRLVGDFYQQSDSSIIIFAHGFTGDRTEWGLFDEAIRTFQPLGKSMLTFDFSGCGESDDDTLTLAKQIDDLQCVLGWVKGRGFSDITIIGFSLGCLVSAHVWSEDIQRLVWWAPVTAEAKDPTMRYTAEQLKELAETGILTKYRDKGRRKVYKIERQMFLDRKNVHQARLLSNVHCPVFIAHGDSDSVVPCEDSKKAIDYLSQGSQLVIVKGADHDFDEQRAELFNVTKEWLLTNEHGPSKV